MNKNHDIGLLLPKKIINLTFILIMRVFILVLYLGLTSIYANSAKAQNEISVKVQGASLQTLFTTIQQKSDYVFFYNDDLLSSAKKVSLSFIPFSKATKRLFIPGSLNCEAMVP